MASPLCQRELRCGDLPTTARLHIVDLQHAMFGAGDRAVALCRQHLRDGAFGADRCLDFRDNGLKNTFHIFEHLIVPEPDYAVAAFSPFFGALCIIRRRVRMLPAVELDSQLARRDRDIRNIFANRMLPTNSMRQIRFAQCAP